MNGLEDDNFMMNGGSELKLSMFPTMDTPSEMDLDEPNILAAALKDSEFDFLNETPESQPSNYQQQNHHQSEQSVPPAELGSTDHFVDPKFQWEGVDQPESSIDPMEPTQSPAFTMDLNLYFDTYSTAMPESENPPSGATTDVRSLFTNEDQADQTYPNFRSQFGAQSLQGISPESSGASISVQRNPSHASFNRHRAISLSERMENTYLQPHPDRYYGKHANNMQHAARNLVHLLPAEFSYQGHSSQSPENDNRSSTYLDTPDINPGARPNMERRDNASFRTSILGHNNDLLPFTTNTSFTPSINSLQLNQPSFVSAQQYFRLLVDQGLQNLGRGSLEVYSRYGLTPDSISLGTPPNRPQRSFASYFSFMDKDRKQPAQQAQHSLEDGSNIDQPQPRTLIRSIFKGGNHGQQVILSQQDEMAIYNSVLDENQMLVGTEDESYPKAPKRVKKGIFDRFKPNKSTDVPQDNRHDTTSQGSGGNENDPTNLELLWAKTNLSSQSQPAISRTSSALNSGNTSFGTSLNAQNSAGLDNLKTLEPNYGALFKGVAKRRTLVTMKGKKKSLAQIKKDIKLEESILDSLNGTNVKQEPSDMSPQLSCVSSRSKDPDNEEQTSVPGTLATASKRILGSRLLKRKGSPSIKPEPSSNVVEVDLQKLDLPVDTEILPQIPPKSRPRGRREDKEADLVDDAKIYICGYCARRFKRQEHLKRHFRSLHTAERPYDCPICQKKFSRSDNLNQHLRVHKQEGQIKEEELEGLST
ncbi:hypothetical protein PUMCH_002963 [Australozyma saopauloensis]|uniref:C2H2-type domain-containing protein n=1 Tax=Australozyma saopauloensis TaxID=291208 RepID=A0AAX4HB43_9ASCO|nr:hypothetical protein PUMCH_002963 [[Candida] saopauloensis]